MSSIKILHNPRCSKSRQTLALLQEQGIEPEIVLYLENPLSETCIEQLKTYLNITSVREMMRTKEDVYKAMNLKEEDEKTLISAMVENPKLIERPIVIRHGDKGIQARIGRPPENVLEILS
jgi:arsenate reductase